MYSPIAQPRCYEGSFFHVCFGHVRRYQRNRAKTWIRSQCCRSIHPIPNHVRRQPVPYYSSAANVIDGCNHMCMIQLNPRCKHVQWNGLLPRLLWHKWMLFRGILWTRKSRNDWKLVFDLKSVSSVVVVVAAIHWLIFWMVSNERHTILCHLWQARIWIPLNPSD